MPVQALAWCCRAWCPDGSHCASACIRGAREAGRRACRLSWARIFHRKNWKGPPDWDPVDHWPKKWIRSLVKCLGLLDWGSLWRRDFCTEGSPWECESYFCARTASWLQHASWSTGRRRGKLYQRTLCLLSQLIEIFLLCPPYCCFTSLSKFINNMHYRK